MSIEHLWVAPGDVVTDISGHVELPKPGGDGFQLATNAEEGSVGSSDLMLDDPDGDLYITGLNAYRARETLSEAADPYLFAGHFGRRKEKRGPYMTGPSRQIAAQVQDANAILSRYVATEDDDADRPQESEEDRMTWLFTISAMVLHFDFATSTLDLGSTVMPKADLTGYTVQQIVGEMATMTGKNYYVWWDGVDEAYELIYARDSGTHLTSDLRFSNVESDHDGVTTFARNVGLDWELDINPERIVSNATVRGANGLVTEIDFDTGTEFGRTDRVFDANLIKTDALLSNQALQYLADLDEEELVVSGTVYLPAEKASQFRAGMRCEMKATHLTGMSSFVWVRLLNVTIVNISSDPTLTYALAFEGTLAPGFVCANIIGALEGQASGPLTFTPVEFTLTETVGEPFLAIATCAVGATGAFSNGGSLAADAPWTSLGPIPGSGGATHTESAVAYQSNAAGFVEFSWASTGFGGGGYIQGVCIPTTATAPTQLLQLDGGTGADIVFPSPPAAGSMLLLFRVAEGPTGWAGDPGGADWVLVDSQDGYLPNPNASSQIWVCCTPENLDTLSSNTAGSSWWAHVLEIDIS